MNLAPRKPSAAFVGASWTALFLGALTYCIGLFAAVSVQKSVRDRLEGIPVTNIYYGLSWVSVLMCLVLTTVGLWNASVTLSEKGFFAMAYVLSLFAAIAVQKNTRDSAGVGEDGVVS